MLQHMNTGSIVGLIVVYLDINTKIFSPYQHFFGIPIEFLWSCWISINITRSFRDHQIQSTKPKSSNIHRNQFITFNLYSKNDIMEYQHDSILKLYLRYFRFKHSNCKIDIRVLPVFKKFNLGILENEVFNADGYAAGFCFGLFWCHSLLCSLDNKPYGS